MKDSLTNDLDAYLERESDEVTEDEIHNETLIAAGTGLLIADFDDILTDYLNDSIIARCPEWIKQKAKERFLKHITKEKNNG